MEQAPNLLVYHTLGYLLPYIAELIKDGKVKPGSKEIQVDGKACQFSGFLHDATGVAHGTGQLVFPDDSKLKGTFYND